MATFLKCCLQISVCWLLCWLYYLGVRTALIALPGLLLWLPGSLFLFGMLILWILCEF